MYAVIFRASIKKVDQEYRDLAKTLRNRAFEEYGCKEFVSTTENGEEISISYWEDLEQIKRWKEDPLHREAQKKGAERWYKNYQVQITKLLDR